MICNGLHFIGVNKVDLIKDDNYYAFRVAGQGGHVTVLKKLMKLAPDQVPNMIAASHTEFWTIAMRGHTAVINMLFSCATIFADAEMHDREWGQRYVYPFVTKKLELLHSQQATLAAHHPHAVFDLNDAEEIKLCFYIIRNLIRRHAAHLLDDLRFLLDIPGVRALAHTAVTPNQENELLRLALTLNNREAAEILLAIPAVRVLAAQHNYYEGELLGQFNLRDIAQDRENSMKALNPGEQKSLASAISHYQPIIAAATAIHIMQDLRNELIARYQKNPAKIMLNIRYD